MINKKILHDYNTKYENLKEQVFHSEVVKVDLERQSKREKEKIKRIKKKIIKEVAKINEDLQNDIKQKLISLKNMLERNLLGDFAKYLVFSALGFLVIPEMPLYYLFLAVATFVTALGMGADVINYNTDKKEIKKMPFVKSERLINLEISLAKSKNKAEEITTILNNLNNYLNSLKDTKGSIENLIWHLYYPDDELAHDKPLDNTKWLEIDLEDEKVEVTPVLLRKNPYERKTK